MEKSSLQFITCDELREEFKKCEYELDKRLLIIDVRDALLYDRSHLCLDKRSDKKPVKTMMRVMNIDPDRMKTCTLKNIMSILNPDDLKIFERRKDASDVIVIDKNTDNLQQLSNPKSKVMRLMNALTKFDTQVEKKIVVPVTVLRGGFREWLLKYPHFTTDSTFDPDTDEDLLDSPKTPATPSILSPSLPPRDHILKPFIRQPAPVQASVMTPPDRPVPSPPRPPKNAPGTAVQLNLRNQLPRSHSSPNVAQGDELDESSSQFDVLRLTEDSNRLTVNNNMPKFDRALKPAHNNEAIKLIKAQLNFGRSPESSGKVISGLQNLGNTCFMNSVIQCLAYTPALVSYFSSENHLAHINLNSQYGSKGELAVEFGALVDKLNSHRHRYIEPRSFRDAVTKHVGFAGNEQQDSHEFMMMLFDKLHHDLNINAKVTNGRGNNGDEDNSNVPREKLAFKFWGNHLEHNRSIISDLYEGIFMSTLTCTSCRSKSDTFEVFNCLSLPIPSETRCQLRDCLNHFSNPERIDAAWECPKCKQKREAEKKIVICKLPKILIIHLKRFSLDGRWRSKLQTTVEFPLTDMKVDCTNVLPPSPYWPMGNYHLFAVVNHYGHLDGGHYTAFSNLSNRNWYTFDDSNVSEMDSSDVCGQSAYILFYGTPEALSL